MRLTHMLRLPEHESVAIHSEKPTQIWKINETKVRPKHTDR